MSQSRRKIDKSYNKLPFENENGLSTYDIALISLAKKARKTKLNMEDNSNTVVAA